MENNTQNIQNQDVQNQNAHIETENQNQEPQVEKMFTQAQLEEILASRLARETKKIKAEQEKNLQLKLKAELEESEKLAKMSETERIKAQAEKDRKKFEEDRKQYLEEKRAFEKERILNTTMKTLAEKNLPVEFAKFMNSESAEDIMENIMIFEKHFNEALEKAVQERLKGRVPASKPENKGLSMEDVKNMSAAEINANWNAIKGLLNK